MTEAFELARELQDSGIRITILQPARFAIAVEFWISMRRELRISDGELPSDWRERAVAYFRRRHAAGELQWFIAARGDEAVGSAAGFVRDGYPTDICTERRQGYVAGVYVQPQFRRRGLARALTSAAVGWLRSIRCGTIRLHAAERARPIYVSLGFQPSNEMVLQPSEADSC